MKNFSILTLLAALLFVGCSDIFVELESPLTNEKTLPDLTANFADDGLTRTYVEAGKYLRWHEADLITAFYGNTLNRQYKFKGKTGDNSGTFSLVPSGELGTGNNLDAIYALYPYDENATITDEGVISLTIPSEQSYAENSFGKGANTMVAVTESVEDTFLSFKNACGYLKLYLYNVDGATLKSVSVKGNNNEKIAGAATVAMTFGDTPEVTMSDDTTTAVTLDCGEGIALGTTSETATALWIVLPETTFEKGITITVTDTEGSIFEKSTSNSVAITRNDIQPMAALAVEFVAPVVKPANNEIWYTNGSTTEATTPYKTNVFGVNIVSNTYDAEKECWVIKFGGDVTKIGTQAFLLCSSLTSVNIPDSVTTIGDHAFARCGGLKSVTMGNSVTTIVYGAFSDCSSLTSVNIPDSVTTIGDYAFEYCSNLTSVTIPDNVTTIADNAFDSCSGLTSLTIPDSVTTIGYEAFKNCRSLTSVTIPNSVTKIGNGAFDGCSSLTSANIGDSVTTIGNYAFSNCSSLTSVTIPDSVTSIGDFAFYCNSLTSVYITDIAAWCNISFSNALSNPLYDAENLYLNNELVTDLIIPDSVTSIGDYAFKNCSSLTSVTIPDNVTTIGDNAFDSCSGLTSLTIPDSVTTIGDSAFTSCYMLQEFKGNFASEDGRCLIQDGTLIAFAPAGLTEYAIPNSVTTIGNYAFGYCYDLTSVNIPDSVTTIRGAAFFCCTSLTSVYCEATTPPTGDSTMFSDNAPNRKIYVPRNSVEAYKSAEYWSYYASYIVGYDFATDETLQPANNEIWYTNGSTTKATKPTKTNVFGVNIVSNTYDTEKECWVIKFDGEVTTIGRLAFFCCSSLTSVTIPDSVTTIGDEAFESCSSLTSVTIPDSVTTISDNAFSDCSMLQEFKGKFASEDGRCLIIEGVLNSFAPAGLTEYAIPNSVTSIGYSAFDCTSLTSVTIPDSVTTISDNAFSDCSMLQEFKGKFASDGGRCLIQDGTLIAFAPAGLTEYAIPNSVTTIGDSAFQSCSNLTSVTIPDSVTTIGDLAFYLCSSLTSVNIPDSVTTIGDDAFESCSSLTSVTIPDSVTTIGYRAFCSCSGLTSVTIPDSVTTIGDWAFCWCGSLTSVYCEATTPPTGYSEMFINNPYDRKIYVPRNSVDAYKSASGWSDYASDIVGYDF